jgi:hypothetical protein
MPVPLGEESNERSSSCATSRDENTRCSPGPAPAAGSRPRASGNQRQRCRSSPVSGVFPRPWTELHHPSPASRAVVGDRRQEIRHTDSACRLQSGSRAPRHHNRTPVSVANSVRLVSTCRDSQFPVPKAARHLDST